MLVCLVIKSRCFVFQTSCILMWFPGLRCPTFLSVCFLFLPEACVRVRIKGEKAPELLLELLDDERTQTFLTQVKSAQQQGKPQPSVSIRISEMMNYLFSHLTFIHWGWITPLADFLFILATHTQEDFWNPILLCEISWKEAKLGPLCLHSFYNRISAA